MNRVLPVATNCGPGSIKRNLSHIGLIYPHAGQPLSDPNNRSDCTFLRTSQKLSLIQKTPVCCRLQLDPGKRMRTVIQQGPNQRWNLEALSHGRWFRMVVSQRPCWRIDRERRSSPSISTEGASLKSCCGEDPK